MPKLTPASTAALIVILAMTGCDKTEVPPPAAPSSAATTTNPAGPSANAPSSGHWIKLSEGLDLAQVKNQEMIHPQFGLTPPDVDTSIIFAVVQNAEATASSPLILKKIGSGWKIVKLAEADYQEWVYAAAISGRKEIWGILDISGENHAAQLTLVRSVDDGLSWQFFAAVKKPTRDAEYAGFSMADNGEGRLSVHLDDDTDGIAHGYYHYKTVDGGKQWTGPTFEGDDIIQADPLNDVDTLEEAIKNAEAGPATQTQ
jgi:hypothetical protein